MCWPAVLTSWVSARKELRDERADNRIGDGGGGKFAFLILVAIVIVIDVAIDVITARNVA